ncbi:transcriptional regulator, TraR/DksA family [Desulfonatronum thiosulfatophilum]|uniref:Transcriptional regulator, TraR/DksA family n=1 Tax=Desulfonatronum thiosulfatophilum TaxID=617002 RepID=A0A1G6E3S4_9BACT|nr:TraR/DksA C4-type zinc finger protein [Desulfonatronum thiosulfatophilum]SDB52099.1 transcriptional regulator, TraR/DksA family [Desulfonatronum thiosulfatophilum]
MIRKEITEKAHQLLQTRREELREMRRENEESNLRLSEPQVEFEERAQQEKMQQELESLDRRNRDELDAVNMALQRIGAGTYGLCLECGEEISEKRLLAIPWTATCIECAGGGKEEIEPPVVRLDDQEESAQPMNETYAGLVDEELCDAIMEHLHYDGRVELEDLRVHCEGERIELHGALPSQESSDLLHEIIEDTFGVHDIVDNLRIDPEAWERPDRTPGVDIPQRSDEETVIEGEPGESNYFVSIKDGEPVDPD